MIYIDAEHLQDGLYNIKDGEIYKYKVKGGTVRAYKLIHRPQAEWVIELDANGNTYGRCPICGMRQYAGQINFCPECGSDMRKGARDEASN